MTDVRSPLTATMKPRLAFFRWPRAGLSPFLLVHLAEQVACLEQWFDVHVVSEANCDYDQVCDELEPDMCLFESGVYAGDRHLTRTWAHPQVPKLGFLHADAFDTCRATALADMASWGVEEFVTTSVSMGDYTPEIADHLFVWPNFVDPAVFQDYRLEKVIPVLFTGSQAPHYPWRNLVWRSLSSQLPTMTCPHFGWNNESGAETLPVGEAYARMIAASTFVPACGTITNDVVRKHLEVPAVRSCLVAERTAALEAAGFCDMRNVVFAEPDDVVEKLNDLLKDPARLTQIIDAGHDLVHRRHTIERRDEVYQWFVLKQAMSPGARIIQEGPFGQLRIVEASSRRHSRHVITLGRDRVLIQKGWQRLRAGDATQAQRLFLRCLNYYFIPEAIHGVVRAALRLGDVDYAASWLQRWLTHTFEYNRACAPDPTQWALKIRVDLCAGEWAQAARDVQAYPEVSNAELSRTRCAAARLVGLTPTHVTPTALRPTVAPCQEESDRAWLAELEADLDAGCRSSSAPRLLRTLVRRGRRVGGGWVREVLRPLKRRVVSGEWERAVAEIVRREDVDLVAILDSSPTNAVERVIRHTARQRTGSVKVLSVPTRRAGRRTHDQAVTGTDDPTAQGNTIAYLNRSSGWKPWIIDCTVVILDDVDSIRGHDAFDRLLGGGFKVLGHAMVRGRGRAILHRAECPRVEASSPSAVATCA